MNESCPYCGGFSAGRMMLEDGEPCSDECTGVEPMPCEKCEAVPEVEFHAGNQFGRWEIRCASIGCLSKAYGDTRVEAIGNWNEMQK